jgi:hypothetical protein
MRPILFKKKFDPAQERRKHSRTYVVPNYGCRVFPDYKGSIYGEKKVLAMLNDFSGTGFGFRWAIGDLLDELKIGYRYLVRLPAAIFEENLYVYCRFVHRSRDMFGNGFPTLGFEIELMPLGDQDEAAKIM